MATTSAPADQRSKPGQDSPAAESALCGGGTSFADEFPAASVITIPAGSLYQPMSGPAGWEFPLALELAGKPRTKGSLTMRGRGNRRTGRIPLVDSEASKTWRGMVADTAALAMRQQGRAILTGPGEVEFTFRLERLASRPELTEPISKACGDIDKHERNVNDALNGVVWDDDAQVVMTHIRKRFIRPGELPGVSIKVQPYERVG